MLGKGLESLIPPSKGNQQGNNNQPQGQNPQSVTPANPSPQNLDPMVNDPAQPAVEAYVPQAELPEISSGVDPIEKPIVEEGLLDVEPAIVEPLESHLLEDNIDPANELPAPEEELLLPDPKEEQYKARAERRLEEEYVAGRPRPSKEHAVFYLEVNKITPNEHQPRKHFDETAIKDLASSIREYGILQPIVVAKREREVPNGTEVNYELIAGERRLMAVKSLGMERIPAIIRHVDLERERLELAIIENLQRENLNGVEMARAFARLQDEFRLTQREIAVRLGKSRESVANTLRLLDLPSYVQEAIEQGQISDSHGLFLLGINDPAIQQALFHDLITQKLTIRELRHKARILQNKDIKVDMSGSPELKFLEERLASGLGAPVSIHQKGDSGKITIDFYSKEELDGLIRRLGLGEE